ncbi:MAG: hypothetical protein H6616_15510 [Ignavibacteria bacterium]|nr:hypothetical protein [Ignavibacteria bacterium]
MTITKLNAIVVALLLCLTFTSVAAQDTPCESTSFQLVRDASNPCCWKVVLTTPQAVLPWRLEISAYSSATLSSTSANPVWIPGSTPYLPHSGNSTSSDLVWTGPYDNSSQSYMYPVYLTTTEYDFCLASPNTSSKIVVKIFDDYHEPLGFRLRCCKEINLDCNAETPEVIDMKFSQCSKTKEIIQYQ